MESKVHTAALKSTAIHALVIQLGAAGKGLLPHSRRLSIQSDALVELEIHI